MRPPVHVSHFCVMVFGLFYPEFWINIICIWYLCVSCRAPFKYTMKIKSVGNSGRNVRKIVNIMNISLHCLHTMFQAPNNVNTTFRCERMPKTIFLEISIKIFLSWRTKNQNFFQTHFNNIFFDYVFQILYISHILNFFPITPNFCTFCSKKSHTFFWFVANIFNIFNIFFKGLHILFQQI